LDNSSSTNADIVRQTIGESLFNLAHTLSASQSSSPTSSVRSSSSGTTVETTTNTDTQQAYLAALQIAQIVDYGLTCILTASNHTPCSPSSGIGEAIILFWRALEKNKQCQKSTLQQSVEQTILRLIRVSLFIFTENHLRLMEHSTPEIGIALSRHLALYINNVLANDPCQQAIQALLMSVISRYKFMFNVEDIIRETREGADFNSVQTYQPEPLNLYGPQHLVHSIKYHLDILYKQFITQIAQVDKVCKPV